MGFSLPPLPGNIFAMMRKIEEDVIREVLRQYLKREPEPEDGKIVTILKTEGQLDYDLLLDNVYVGKVKFPTFECDWKTADREPWTYTVTFEPVK